MALGTRLGTSFLPVPGLWYHLAYTFDDTAKRQALYVNGLQVASGVASRSIGYDNQPLLLGRDVVNGAPKRFLHGSIDEATIYNRELRKEEIAWLYVAGAAGKNL